MGRRWLLNLSSLLIFVCIIYFVLATAPTHTQPILNSSSGLNVDSDNLTCFNQSTSDPDGYNVSNIFNFYKNGKLNSSRVHYDNLIFWFPTDYNESKALDYSENDYNGTITNAAFTASGKLKGAYFFDGTSHFAIAKPLLISENFTAFAWVKFSSFPAEQGIIQQYPGFLMGVTTNTINCGANECEDFIFKIKNSSNDNNRINISYEDNFNKWTHLLMTYNSTQLRVYVNSELKATKDFTGGVKAVDVETCVGAYDCIAFPGAFFNGTIDEAGVANRSYSDAEVLQLYLGSKDGLGVYDSSDTSVDDEFICEVTPLDPFEAGVPSNSSSLKIQSDICDPPAAGNWNITDGTSCYLNITKSIPANLNISLGSLEIRESGSLSLSGGYLFMNSSSNLTILPGGNITG